MATNAIESPKKLEDVVEDGTDHRAHRGGYYRREADNDKRPHHSPVDGRGRTAEYQKAHNLRAMGRHKRRVMLQKMGSGVQNVWNG